MEIRDAVFEYTKLEAVKLNSSQKIIQVSALTDMKRQSSTIKTIVIIYDAIISFRLKKFIDRFNVSS